MLRYLLAAVCLSCCQLHSLGNSQFEIKKVATTETASKTTGDRMKVPVATAIATKASTVTTFITKLRIHTERPDLSTVFARMLANQPIIGMGKGVVVLIVLLIIVASCWAAASFTRRPPASASLDTWRPLTAPEEDLPVQTRVRFAPLVQVREF